MISVDSTDIDMYARHGYFSMNYQLHVDAGASPQRAIARS